MANVKKIQVSIPIDEYDKVEARWKSYGFSSVAEAAKVLLMGDLNEHIKEMRRHVAAVEKLEELNAKKRKATQHAKPKEQPKEKPKVNGWGTGENLPRGDETAERLLKLWFEKGSISKEQYDTVKGVRRWVDQNNKRKNALWT